MRVMTLWISCLVAQYVLVVDAHLSISHPIIIKEVDRRSSLLTTSLIRIRGGASESASRSSWTAGSKYNYGAGSKSYNYGSNTVGTSSSLQTPSSYNTNSKDTTNVNDIETKEKFAEAFLQRDDRNRFIGKLCTLICVISFTSPILTTPII